MASRRKSRILAFQALYAWEASRLELSELLGYEWLDKEKREGLDPELIAFASLLISGTLENIDAVDKIIQRHVEHWSFERLKRVDLAILRVAAYSLMYQKEIPPQITIDEAIEIAKEYGSDDSFRFVNGVLDAIWKSETPASVDA